MENYSFLIFVIPIVLILFFSLKTIQQGTVGVVTVFGKYRRIARPGLNFLIPIFEQINKKLSLRKQI